MELHYLTLHRLTEEIREKFIGSAIQHCYTQRKNEFIINILTKNQTQMDLVFSSDAGNPFVLFRAPQKRSKISTEVMEELTGCQLQNVTILENDRILIFAFTEPSVRLIVQLFRNRTNFFIINQKQEIVNAFKQGKKYIGSIYDLERQEHQRASPENVEEFIDTLMKSPSISLQKNIRKTYFFLSRVLINEIESRLGFSLNQPTEDYQTDQFGQIFQEITAIIRNCRKDRPRIYIRESKPIAFALTKLVQFKNCEEEEYSSINDALMDFLFTRLKVEKSEKKYEKISSLLENKLHQINELLQQLQRLPDDAAGQRKYQKMGELLLAQTSLVPAGQSQVSLTDLFDPHQKKMVIQLNPKLSASENAQAYFDRAKGVAEKNRQIRQNIKQLIQQKKRLEKIKVTLEEKNDFKTLTGIEKQLKEMHILQTDTDKLREVYLPYKRYFYQNWEIWVGKNSRDNDELTFRRAHKEDLWFHAQGVSGSHVIVHKTGKNKEIPKDVREYAARLAAINSRAKHSKYVPVIYTPVKYVRKPRGSAPGAVMAERIKSMFVELT